jgi:hypothetical protein
MMFLNFPVYKPVLITSFIWAFYYSFFYLLFISQGINGFYAYGSFCRHKSGKST